MLKVACEPQVGSDVEVFLKNGLGHIVPCVGLFKGTKAAPWTPDGVEEGYAIQEDNVMCEFNVPPTPNGRTAYYIMQAGKDMVRREASRLKLTPAWDVSSHEFQPKDLQSAQAQQIGCDPDNDAYTGGEARTTLPNLTNWRSAGGHIHLGGDFKCPDFVAALFAELFISLAGNRNGCMVQDERSKWYGRPGIYRSKPYGIEYRTPNNAWVHSQTGMERTVMQSVKCAKWLTNTSSTDIQAAFRAIPWTKQRDIMIACKREGVTDLLRIAKGAGVPVL